MTSKNAVHATPGPAKNFRRSRKWIQKLVCDESELFAFAIHQAVPQVQSTSIEWRSPTKEDGYREYRDGKALRALDLHHLRGRLTKFWPARGPVWDALGIGNAASERFLVEAKAHIAEVVTSPTAAAGSSLRRIRTRLNAVKRALGSRTKSDWTGAFYQYANRLAYLNWLHERGVRAYLVGVYFTNAPDVPRPVSEPEWQGALAVLRSYLGLSQQHRLKPYVVDVFIDVAELKCSRAGIA